MGQARLRRQEIQLLKATGPKTRPEPKPKPRVYALGAYYHDDLPDGVGVFLSADSEPTPGWVNLTFNTLVQLVNQECASTTDLNRESRIQEAWQQLHENILQYNRLIFGSDQRVIMADPRHTDLTPELIEIFVNIIASVWYLEIGRAHV